MKNAWLNYILIRVGLFVGVLVILVAIGLDKFVSALFAAMISLAISLIFFNKQRERVSEAVYKRINRNETVGTDDSDSDHENAVLDSQTESDEK
jgi:hypothetical protein